MKPVLQALVLAERVYQDITGKKIIAGTFNRVFFSTDRTDLVREETLSNGETQQFITGGMHGGSPYAYISLTDVVANTELILQFVNLTKNVTLLETRISIPSQSRLDTIEIVSALPPLPIREVGIYAFEVVCEGQILGSHRLVAEPMPKPPDPADEG